MNQDYVTLADIVVDNFQNENIIAELFTGKVFIPRGKFQLTGLI
jgi:hypothetical protein